ncbi:IspD/TarI family cytidylyltransferase, partial [Marinovum algicola]|uniref:IspD/TarI family cytidylyltransferase n=1 Tax=Marinovum algicola TaxID=42444 RepID=UPI0024BA111B
MASTPNIAALIVAAGRGTRAGGAVPKQWQPLCGKRVIDHTLAAFQRHPLVDRIIIVLNASDMAQAEGFTAQGCLVAEGGADRAASVRNGLALLGDADLVLIHDAARPCVTPQTI